MRKVHGGFFVFLNARVQGPVKAQRKVVPSMKICLQQCHALVNVITLMGICISGLAACLEDSGSTEVGEEYVPSLTEIEYAYGLNDHPERALEAHGRPLYPTTIEPPSAGARNHAQQAATPLPKNIVILSFDHDRREGRENTMMALEALLKNTQIKNIAFEFPGDMQDEFDNYFATRQGPRDMLILTMGMLSRYPQSSKLSRSEKLECARKIMATQGIRSLIDVAWVAKRHGAKVLLVDTPMAEVRNGDPKIVLRNRAMARKLTRFSGGKTVLLLVGNAHTGHGTLGVSLDDQLTQMGASTMSICVSANPIRARKDWGTEMGTADYHLTKTAEIVNLVTSRISGNAFPRVSDHLTASGTNSTMTGLSPGKCMALSATSR